MNTKTPSDSMQRESDIPAAEAMPGTLLPTAETAGQGVILPTAKDTMGRVAGTEYGGITGEAVSFRIGRTEENAPVVIVEEDILKDVPAEKWISTVKKNLKKEVSGRGENKK